MVLKLQISQEKEQKFRELAMRQHGFSRGAIKKAGDEALDEWIRKHEQNLLPKKVKDPIASIQGILKHLKGKSRQ